MSIPEEFQQSVREIVAEVVGVELEEVEHHSNFFDDLGGESIDVLDLDFHLEKRLGAHTNFHKMFSPDRWELDESGRPTPDSIRRLREDFPHVALPVDADSANMKDNFTVTFIVETAHRAATNAAHRKTA